MKKLPIIICFGFLTQLMHPLVGAQETSVVKDKKTIQKEKERQKVQEQFFSYTKVVFKWTQIIQKLMESEDFKESSRSNLDGKISNEIINQIEADLHSFRDFLKSEKKNDLNKLYDESGRDYSLIPDEIYSYIKKTILNGKINAQEFIDAIAGVAQVDKDGEWVAKKSLLLELQSFDMNQWPPVKRFIDNFTTTVFDDEKMASSIGNLLHPFVKLYFSYQDNVTRARYFENICEHWKRINLTGDPEIDLDILSGRIFQNGGPILVKFFQILKEESKNSSDLPIKRVLLELKNIPPMEEKVAINLAADYVKTTTQFTKVTPKNFGWGNYLAIASIGETHLVQIGELKAREDFVMKLHRQGIEDIFNREVRSVVRMFNAQESNAHFDKGLKHSIFNMIKGIREELDFRFERRNIKMGKDAYGVKLNHPYLTTIDLPHIVDSRESSHAKNELPYSKANQHVMVMTKAQGAEVASILESSNAEQVYKTFNAMVQLYKDYLSVALDPKYSPNFYHGDLHAGNMFIDFEARKEKDQALVTLIDFGRAGQLSSEKQDAMINIMLKTRDISKSFFDDTQNKNINNLASELEKFLLSSFEEPGAGFISNHNEQSLKSYFRVCFNPDILPAFRNKTQSELENRAVELKTLRDSLKKNALPPQFDKEIRSRLEQMKLAASSKKSNSLRDKLFSYSKGELSPGYQSFIDDIQDQIDFINALNSHCMDAIESPLLLPLKNKNMLVSDKLRIIFKEMQRNGIPIPEEMIFFNKSKSLLEGIINNLMEQMENLNISHKRVSVEEIFTSTIESIKKSIKIISRKNKK